MYMLIIDLKCVYYVKNMWVANTASYDLVS